MKTTEINLFSFDELTKPVAEKILASYREDLVIDYDIVVDCFKEDIKESLGASGIEVFWSGFYSQGDGACFTCEFDTSTLLELPQFKDNKKYDRVRELSGMGFISLDISSHRTGPSNFYSHENTVEAHIHCEIWDCQLTEEDRNLIDEMGDEITELIRETSRGLYRSLEDHYDVCSSTEVIIEDLQEMGECFTSSGKVLQELQ